MFSIDKDKFAAFVSALRKEKGMTQKELATALFVSDKAVSKWETAQSLPDVSLLIPLAEILGVTVTELLQGERMENPRPLPAEKVETLVKTAVSIAEENKTDNRKGYILPYAVSLAVALLGLCFMNYNVSSGSAVMKNTAFLLAAAAAVGAYFVFFAPVKLPRYYDENKISSFSRGPVRINMRGVELNNSNWPYIVRGLRRWAVFTLFTAAFVTLATAFLVEYVFVALSPPYPNPLHRVTTWENTVLAITYFIYLGSMCLAVYIPGKKYK